VYIAKKMEQFSSNILQDLNALMLSMIAQGKEVINLSVGTPDLPPDTHVMEAVSKAALDPENYKYSLQEMPELIAAVQDWYRRRYGVELAPSEIAAVNGSQEGIAHVAFPFCDPGDVVLTPDPCYPIFSFGPFLAGARIVPMPLRKANDFLIDLDAISPEDLRQARLMVVSYPNNPVTATAPREFYERLVAFAKEHDLLVIHDNAYSELVLDEAPGMSFLAVEGAKEVGIEFNSLSKSYNLTGARISFALGNAQMIEKLRTLRSQIDYGVFYPVQIGAIAALTGPQDILERNRAAYRERRQILCQGLRDIGWEVPDSKATMFAWFPLPGNWQARQKDSMTFVYELLERSGVMCVPGSSFGPAGEGFVRMALVQPPDKLRRAIENIRRSGILQN
jgi:LL-diaminopimelate aminotransferase